jgi:hypothetical protein
MEKRIFSFLVSLLFVFSTTLYSQITLTFPTVSGLPNTEVNAAVTVSNLSGLNITSFQFQVNFDNTVIDIIQIVSSGSMAVPESNAGNTTKTFLRVAWASATPLSGSGTLFNIRIKFKTSGTSPLTYIASDGDFTSVFGSPSQNITVTPVNGSASISTTNNPPVFTPVTDKTIKAGQTLSFQVSATDPEGQTLTYTSSNVPTGAAFSQSTRTFTWTPLESQVGDYNVTFFASDGTNTVSIIVKITVTSSNTPPVFNPVSDQQINEGQLLSFQVTATDADSDPLTYSVSNLPQGATFTPANGVFEWIPMFTQAGVYNVTFSVSDGKSTTNKIVKITVVNVNRAPMFTVSMPNREVTVHNVPVEFSFQYQAMDPDEDALTYTIVTGPAGATINSAGLFKWSPAANQASMMYLLTVQVSDGNLSATTSCNITTSPLVSVEDKDQLPSKFNLAQNYPNPFNPETTIEYSIPEDAFVSIKVYSMLGEEIATLVNSQKSPGTYRVQFDAKDLQSGIYFYKLVSNSFTSVRKMLYLR